MPINSIFMRFPGGLAKCLTLSYDDAVMEDFRLVEIMKKHGLRGTFNINSGLYRPHEKCLLPTEGTGHRMSVEMATELFSQDGIEPAVHAHMHSHLQTQPPAQVAYEIMKNREVLEEQFGKIVRGMAYPFGTCACTDQVVEVLKNCGITYARTTVSTEKFSIPTDWLRMPATCHHKNPRLGELTTAFLEKRVSSGAEPLLFYLWGHSYEFENDQNWEIIEHFAEQMGDRDDIWYATNDELYEYVEAFRSLVFASNMRYVQNPSAKTVCFTLRAKPYTVAPGETLKLDLN
ncbi:MAG: polysaccharide deacetylase family protein [Clostridia bacterium]|nr:polysaccharide deacetylase family protein [Clostridia bacterium]